eukprot:3356914-Amphidinium_carterae.1
MQQLLMATKRAEASLVAGVESIRKQKEKQDKDARKAKQSPAGLGNAGIALFEQGPDLAKELVRWHESQLEGKEKSFEMSRPFVLELHSAVAKLVTEQSVAKFEQEFDKERAKRPGHRA